MLCYTIFSFQCNAMQIPDGLPNMIGCLEPYILPPKYACFDSKKSFYAIIGFFSICSGVRHSLRTPPPCHLCRDIMFVMDS